MSNPCKFLLVSLLAVSQSALALMTDPGSETVAVTNGTAELSGVTYAGGDTYLAIGDRTLDVFTLNVPVDGASGEAGPATVIGNPLVLDMAVDTEAIRLLSI